MTERRVLLLTATLESGGLERQLTLLAGSLPAAWRPLVWSAADGPFRVVLEEAGVALVADERRARLDPRPFLRLAALIVSRRPDVVHAWHWMPAAVAAPVCRLAGIPFIDGSIRLGRPNPEFGRPRPAIMRLATAVVANSHAGLAAWGVEPPKGRVIYNAFDPGRLASAESAAPAGEPGSRPFTVVMTGRLHPHKDYRSLLAAARLVTAAASGPGDWRFLLVGDGPERETLRREAAGLAAAGVVDFVDPGLEVLPLVAAADAGVLMTDDALHAEGCSNSIMEYMACGLPVVCCDSGGNRELVTDGGTGYVVPPGDATALAARLEDLRADAGRRAAMGAAGRERLLRDFSLERMVGAYTALYDECASARGGRRSEAAGKEP